MGLALIGFIHAVFFYIGDILMTYAVLGFGLLVLSRRSDRARLWVGIALAIGLLLPFVILGPLAELDPNALDCPDRPHAWRPRRSIGGWQLPGCCRRSVAGGADLPCRVVRAAGSAGFQCLLPWILVRAPPDPRRSSSEQGVVSEAGGRWPAGRAPAADRGRCIGAVGFPRAGNRSLDAGRRWDGSGVLTAPVLAAGYLGLLGCVLASRPNFALFAAIPGRTSLTFYIGESVLLSRCSSVATALARSASGGAFLVVLSGILAC